MNRNYTQCGVVWVMGLHRSKAIRVKIVRFPYVGIRQRCDRNKTICINKRVLQSSVFLTNDMKNIENNYRQTNSNAVFLSVRRAYLQLLVLLKRWSKLECWARMRTWQYRDYRDIYAGRASLQFSRQHKNCPSILLLLLLRPSIISLNVPITPTLEFPKPFGLWYD